MKKSVKNPKIPKNAKITKIARIAKIREIEEILFIFQNSKIVKFIKIPKIAKIAKNRNRNSSKGKIQFISRFKKKCKLNNDGKNFRKTIRERKNALRAAVVKVWKNVHEPHLHQYSCLSPFCSFAAAMLKLQLWKLNELRFVSKARDFWRAL